MWWIALALAVLAGQSLTQECTAVSTRKEYRDMSPFEWARFRTALLKLQDPPAGNSTSLSIWDTFSQYHTEHGHTYHG